jgi:hypothetical protein
VIEEVQVVADADHTVHRRGAHADRRRRAGADRATPANLLKPALARGELRTDRAPPPGPNTRSTSRRDAGARPALPGGQGRGADRGRRPCHAARPGRARWRSTTDPHPRRGARRGRCGLRIATSRGRQLPDKAVSLLDTACCPRGH